MGMLVCGGAAICALKNLFYNKLATISVVIIWHLSRTWPILSTNICGRASTVSSLCRMTNKQETTLWRNEDEVQRQRLCTRNIERKMTKTTRLFSSSSIRFVNRMSRMYTRCRVFHASTGSLSQNDIRQASANHKHAATPLGCAIVCWALRLVSCLVNLLCRARVCLCVCVCVLSAARCT